MEKETMTNTKGSGIYNAVVIGAGTAGLVASAGTASLGGRVALVEANKMGGDCLNFGCVPSKTLISSTTLIQRIRMAEEMGLNKMEPDFLFEKIFEHMRSKRAIIEQHDSKDRFENLGVDVFLGRAKFISPHEVEIDDGTRLRGRHFVIATGTKPLIPPVPGIDEISFFTNETLFDQMSRAPKSLLILGGGAIGCESAQTMNRLGVKVTLVEHLPRLLPHDDVEASSLIRKRFEAEGIEVLVSTRVINFEKTNVETVVTVENSNNQQKIICDAVLIATGRKANVDGLGLEAAGVEYNHRSIEVDATLATSQHHIFACGDVAGPYQFTHSADHQARIVIRNILIPWLRSKADYTWVPRVTYTDPQLAQIGLTEKEAKNKGINYKSFRYDWNELDRAIIDSQTTGFIKVLTEPGKDRILGATIIGVNADEVMHEVLVAAKHGIGLNKLSSTIHAYPTLSSSVQRVADKFQQTRLSPWIATIFRWLYRLRCSG